MAVTPVGQNRPQVPAQLEATPLAAEKSGAGGAVAVAQASAGPNQAVQAPLSVILPKLGSCAVPFATSPLLIIAAPS